MNSPNWRDHPLYSSPIRDQIRQAAIDAANEYRPEWIDFDPVDDDGDPDDE